MKINNADKLSIASDGKVTATNDMILSSATDSSSSTTGALKVAGGVGIKKNLFVGENTEIEGTLDVNCATTLSGLTVTGSIGSGAITSTGLTTTGAIDATGQTINSAAITSTGLITGV